MHRIIATTFAAVLVGVATLASTPVPAAERNLAPFTARDLFQPAQFYGGEPYQGDDWERRRHRREWRREREERRIEEAARREAWRIEREREERRAWRRAMRGQHGYGPAYGYRSW